jgi:hypothetical protein
MFLAAKSRCTSCRKKAARTLRPALVGRGWAGLGWAPGAHSVCGSHLHFCQVLHTPRDLPGEGDEVTHGQYPFIWVVQRAGVAAASTAHIGRPNLAAVTEESPQGAILGILHNEKKWPWGQRESRSRAQSRYGWLQALSLHEQLGGHRPALDLWIIKLWQANSLLAYIDHGDISSLQGTGRPSPWLPMFPALPCELSCPVLGLNTFSHP